MNIAISKLDKRYTGHQYFKYSMVFRWQPSWQQGDRTAKFCEMRQWCWETFGPSCSLNEFMELMIHNKPIVNERWCWTSPYEGTPARILIKSEEDKNWFALRWG